MTPTFNELKADLGELLQMQYDYDQTVMTAHEVKSYYEIPIERALLSEIGELNQEMKSEWCWWKFTQKPMDPEKVKEELADVTHFTLMRMLKGFQYYADKRSEYKTKKINHKRFCHFVSGFLKGVSTESIPDFTFAANRLTESGFFDTGYHLAGLMKASGVEYEDFIRAYKAKNAVNRQRVKERY